MSHPDKSFQPSEVQKERMRQLFESLPPGNTPFTLSKEALSGLDRHTRNALLEEQMFRASQLGDTREVVTRIDCPKHKFKKCLRCLPGTDPKTQRASSLDVHTGKSCTYCAGTGYLMHKPFHTFGCAHVCEQDPIKPDGIVITPKRYVVCTICWNLIQRHKLDLQREILTLCLDCVDDEATRLRQIDPKLYDTSLVTGIVPPGSDLGYSGPKLFLPS